ncbi:MAG: hypothetical protein KatS3mg090_0233 [Patescibacteria group bacterium]|nr:MAG: hypothetical protein KatS3mg090_0233 [Patescibacteria group bacterium]
MNLNLMRKLGLFSFFFLIFSFTVLAESNSKVFKARVVNVKNESVNKIDNLETVTQNLELIVLTGQLKGKTINALNQGSIDSSRIYKIGDEVVVSELVLDSEKKQYLVLDYARQNSLIFIFLIFVLVVILIARRKGMFSLLGLLSSVVFIIYFFLPSLAKGENPFVVSILSILFILCFIFPLSHGLNRKTFIAGLATFFSLFITMILAEYFIMIAKISGMADESAIFLQLSNPSLFNIKGIFTASVLIGCLGVLDDVTISQVSVVEELFLNTKKSADDIFRSAMKIGQDHINIFGLILCFWYI